MPFANSNISAYDTCYTDTGGNSYGQINYNASGYANGPITVYLQGDNTGYSAQAMGTTSLSGFFDQLPNDFYEIWCVSSPSAGGSQLRSTSEFFNLTCQQTPPPVACNIAVQSISSTNQSAVGVNDGTATIKVSTTAGGLQIRLTKKLYDSGYQPATSGVNKVFTGLAAGTYEVWAKDANNCSIPSHFVVIQAAVRSGCMDPNATNYDPLATVDNGTCVYVTPPSSAIFHFPILNAFRFVVAQTVNNCSSFITPDNVLFCNENVNGVQRVGYNQKVLQCDTVRTQFHSNRTGHTANLVHLATGATTPLTITNPLDFTNKHATFTATMGINNTNAQTRVYYREDDFTFNLQVGTVVQISNNSDFNGTYAVQAIGQDSASALPWFTINKLWPLAVNVTANATIDSTFNERAYDVYEFDCNFAGKAEGVYKIVVSADAGATQAESEPIEVLPATATGLHLVQWHNLQDGFGLHFSTGIQPKIRVESLLRFPKPAGTRSVTHDGENKLVKISATKTRVREFKTMKLPPYLHEKLAVAFDCDVIRINGRRYQTAEGYEPEYSNRAALANGVVNVEQVGWFDTENSHDLGA